MKLLFLLLALFSIEASWSQFNDSIFFQSGLIHVGEIQSVSNHRISYLQLNNKGDTVKSSSGFKPIEWYKIYDANNALIFNSLIDNPQGPSLEFLKENEQEVSISIHTLSVNPFTTVLLNPNLRYNYTFGKKMFFSLNTRFTFLNSKGLIVEPNDAILIGTGLRIIPYYSRRASFGVDFTPIFAIPFENNPYITPLMSVSVNFDFFLGEHLGLTTDFGFMTDYLIESLPVRMHVGILWMMKGKKTFIAN